MKKSSMIILVFAFAVTLVCMLSACGKTESTGDIVLPSADKVSKVEIKKGDAEPAITDDTEVIANLLKEMATAKDTGKESVSDRPLGDTAVEIIFEITEGEDSTVFMYFSEGDLFLEQPYQGIYSVDKSVADIVNGIK